MSQQPPMIQYATPIPHSRAQGSHVAGALTIAIVVGFVTANPFADAVGFPQVQINSDGGIVFLRIVCGAVMAFVAGVATVFIARGIRTSRHFGFPTCLVLGPSP